MSALPTQGNEDQFRRSMNQGHSAAWEGRWQEAVDHYHRALEQFPDNAPTLNSLALAQLELGNFEQSLELYLRASGVTPEDPLPFEKIAQIYKQIGRTADAVDFSMQAAERHLKLRDAEKAIKNWSRVIQLNPDHLDAHSKLAAVYEKLGRNSQAMTEYLAVASLQQLSGNSSEAIRTGEHALTLNSKNKEALAAVAMLNSGQQLPRPIRQGGMSGPLTLGPMGTRSLSRRPVQPVLEAGLDPVAEARQKALQTLANMLFDLSPVDDTKPVRKAGSRRSIGKVTGLLARGFNETAIASHLSTAIELQSKNKLKQSREALKEAIDAGLDHPAAHFYLGLLLLDEGLKDTAQRSLQLASKHSEFGLAACLLMGDYFREEGEYSNAVVEYLNALSIADSSAVKPEKADALLDAYEPMIQETAKKADEDKDKLLSDNIHHLLMQPNWRNGVSEARGQLPGVAASAAPLPVIEVLTQVNSGRLVDAISRVNHISREGYFRAAMEEAYIALEYSPSYLPLHVQMGELLLMSDHPQQATEKLSTVARVYSVRGERERATQMYERIVAISPLDVSSRIQLIEQLTVQGQLEDAARHTLDLADVYYRLAQLDQARDTYDQALRLVQGIDVDPSWNVQILHQMADIDMQRLDWRKALRVFEQLRTLAPNDEIARLNLVQLNLRLGQINKADLELDNYLSTLNSQSKDKDAENFLSKITEENPDYLLGHRRLAELCQQNGQRENAIKEWNKVGELLVATGDREGAKAALRAILTLNPPNAQRYQQFLDRLSKG